MQRRGRYHALIARSAATSCADGSIVRRRGSLPDTAKEATDPPDRDMPFRVGCDAVLELAGHMRVEHLQSTKQLLYSITSSARADNVGGTSRANSFAVFG